jgi:L-serine/L-threonine ammonia-lyase
MSLPALHVSTPLWESRPLAEILGVPVYLKMEAFQPAGSFKSRGMGAACRAAYQRGARRVVCSSGGNAGLAVSNAGRKLGLDVTIVVPQRTSAFARGLIEREGARLIVHGDTWDDAHVYATQLAAETDSAYIHPFDDPEVWRGHASLIPEIHQAGVTPGLVVVSVGGGGLLSGLVFGMRAIGWDHVPLAAVETEGTASFYQSVRAGRLVTLDGIRSIATTLGARTICQQALDWAAVHPITPMLVSDREALDAVRRFADDHRVLVEPACGAALAVGYGNRLPQRAAPVVFIVCGGAGVSGELLEKWEGQV